MPRPPTVAAGTRRLGALLLAAALGAACGGDAQVTLPGPESPTPPLTRKEYTARANEICRATTEAIVAQTDDVGPPNLDGSEGDRQKLRDAVEPVVNTALAHLRNLTPPPEDRAIAQQAIDALQAGADAAAIDPRAPIDPVGIVRPELFAFGLTGCFTNG